MARTAKSLRAVDPDERAPKKRPSQARPKMSLEDAIENGDQLDIYLAQRRLIAASLQEATASVRPQLSNELNKLNALIAAEDERLEVAAAEQEAAGNASSATDDEAFDASAI
jgi:hypothetical protein